MSIDLTKYLEDKTRKEWDGSIFQTIIFENDKYGDYELFGEVYCHYGVIKEHGGEWDEILTSLKSVIINCENLEVYDRYDNVIDFGYKQIIEY